MYNPIVVYKKGKDIPLPDLLSRDCLPTFSPPSEEAEVLLILPLSDSAENEFKEATEADPELQAIKEIIIAGWPDKVSSVSSLARKYFNFRDELALHEGLLLKGDQIIVPTQLRRKMLALIHQGHLGIESCIKRAKEALFWPGMSTDITTYVNSCAVCQSTQRAKPVEPLHLREVPARPWQLWHQIFFNWVRKIIW